MTEASAAVRDLKFVSSDNEEFLIPSNVIKMSVIVKTMLNDLGLENQETTNEDPIPLPRVNARTLKKVITWCTYRLENPADLPITEGEDEEEELSPYAAEFFNIDESEVFEILMAANYLDIECLYGAACKAIANMMKGLSTQQLREKFNIANDFTPEEEDEISRENAWCHGFQHGPIQ